MVSVGHSPLDKGTMRSAFPGEGFEASWENSYREGQGSTARRGERICGAEEGRARNSQVPSFREEVNV